MAIKDHMVLFKNFLNRKKKTFIAPFAWAGSP